MTTSSEVLDHLRTRAHEPGTDDGASTDDRARADDLAETTGDLSAPIDTVLVTWSASVAALRTAGPDTLVIARVSPTFRPPTGFDPAIVPADDGWDALMIDDPVLAAKRELLATPAAVVAAPWAWSVDGAGTRATAFARALGLTDVTAGSDDTTAIGTLPADLRQDTGDVDALAASLAASVGAPRALVTGGSGSAAAPVTRVGVVPGVATPAQLMALYADLDGATPAVVVVGETVEWEGAPYTEDTIAAGRDVVLVALGTATSEDPATDVLADAVRAAFPDLTVTVHRTAPATWTPEEVLV